MSRAVRKKPRARREPQPLPPPLPPEERSVGQLIAETIRFACDLDLDTIQVSLAAPYPGTQLYDWLVEKGYLNERGSLVTDSGFQDVMVSYPDLPAERIFEGVERFYRRFYFRPRYIGRQVARMVVDRSERRRLLSEGRQFLRFLRERRSHRRGARAELPAAPWEGAARG